jgi:hypothetical protein
LSLWATSSGSRRRSVCRLDLQLPRVPASDRKRLRDAGGFQGGSSASRRPLQRLRPNLGRAGQEKHVFHFCPDCGSQVFYTEPEETDLIVVSVGSFADPSFPPPTESGYDSRRIRGSGCLIRSSALPPSCGGTRRDRSTRPGGTRRRPTAGASSSRLTPTRRTSTTTWPVARVSRAGQPMPSSTSARQSTGGRAVATWRSRTPISIRFATSRRSGNWLRVRAAASALDEVATGPLALVSPSKRAPADHDVVRAARRRGHDSGGPARRSPERLPRRFYLAATVRRPSGIAGNPGSGTASG